MQLDKDSDYQIVIGEDEYRVRYLGTIWSRATKALSLVVEFSDDQVESVPVTAITEIRSVN